MTTPSTTTTTSTVSTSSSNRLPQTSSINGSQVVGNYETSATIQPYIAPQIISFYVREMRPGARVYIFFDGVNVSPYCAPGLALQAGETWDISHYMTVRDGNWGDPIYANSLGVVMGQFNIPEGRFKSGARIIQVADVDDLNDPTKIQQATTLAGATFVGGNLPVVRNIETPTAANPINASVALSQSVIDPTTTNDLVRYGNLTDYYYEFAAQSFTIPNNLGTPGVFISSIDLYFRDLSSSGKPNINVAQGTSDFCTLYICETKEGYPDESAIFSDSIRTMPTYANNPAGFFQKVPYPAIFIPINLSADGSVATRFNFGTHIYLEAGKQYAFVVKVSRGDPKFYLWCSNIGNKDILTGKTAMSDPKIGGNFFYGGGGGTVGTKTFKSKWEKNENINLKFKINVAQFFGVGTGGQTYGDAYFQEKARDYLTLYNVTFPNQSTKPSILPGDVVYLANDPSTNSTSANVVGYDGSTRMHWGVVDHYDPVRQILYVDTSEMWESPFWLNSDTLWPSPTLYTNFRDTGSFPSNSFIQIHRSNTQFNSIPIATYNTQTGQNLSSPPYPAYIGVINGTINNSTIVAYANTSENYNPKINVLVPQFTTLTPPGTTLTFDFLGTSNTFVSDSVNTHFSVLNKEVILPDYERVVISRSTAVSNNTPGVGVFAGINNKSLLVHARFTTDNPYLTPVIDTTRTEVLAIRNLIDPISSTYQEFYNTGSSRSKYISQVVTLAEGQDAEDLQVIVSGYRPPASDIQVWVKFLNSGDSEPFSSKTWTPLKNNNVSLFCDPGNEDDFKDFTFTVPYSYPLIPTTGTITCNSSCTAISGTSTLFETEVGPGWYINMAANSTVTETSRKIISVSSNTSLTLDSPFGHDYTTNAYFIVPPPTTAWLGQNSTTKVDGLVTTSTTNNVITGYSVTFTANTSKVNNTNETITLTNANTYFNPDDRIYYRVPAGNTAITGLTANTWYYVKTSNTTTITLTDTLGGSVINLTAPTTNPGETHELLSTNFTYWYQPGSIINVGGDSQIVVSVANDTHMTVGSPWTSNNTNQPAYLVTSSGLTYEDSTGAVYSSYKKFQIKIILQSNDTSKVPLLNSLRALSMQL